MSGVLADDVRDEFRAAAHRPGQCFIGPPSRILCAQLADQRVTLLPVPCSLIAKPGGLAVMLAGLLRADV